MERMVELKRKSRNLSEKKRRDQFNTLINELNNLIDPHFNNIDSNDNNGATSNINGGVSYTNNISYNIFNQQSAPTNGLGTFESASSGRYKSAGSTTSSIAGSVSRQRKLDKSSVLRCAMEFLKKQSFSSSSSSSISSFSTSGSFDGKKLDNGGSNMDSVCESFENNYIESWKPSYITDDEFSMQMLETLDAFIVVCEVNSEARIVYSSDTLSSLLRYTGTCSSIESHDYVSLFDLIAPFDRPQIEKIFVDQTSSNINGGNATTSGCNTNSGKNNNQSTANNDSRSSSPSSQPSEYISMVVNFRNNLNLTKIKLKRLQQSNGDSSSTLFEQQNDDKISQDDSSSLSRKSNHQQHQGHQQQEEDQQQQQQQVMQQQHKQQLQPLVGQQQLHQRQQQNFHCSHNNQQQQQQQTNQMRRQKQTLASSRQQYELVRLMATFRGLDINTIRAEDSSFDRYKFEEPPPNQTNQKSRYFICIGRLDVPRLSYDLKIIVPPLRGGTNLFHNNQFLSKHTLKWRLLWVDNRASAIIGYLPFEVLGTSGYDYYHWDDLDKLVICHEGLMRSGQATSGPYRFLTKGQQWIWLQTKYSIIPKPAKGNASNQFKFILCTHTVVGFDENDGYVNSATECFS